MKKVSFSLLTVVSILFTFTSTQCQKWGRSISGEGGLVEKTFTVDDFDGLGIGITAKVYVRKGSSNEITIKGQENIIENIEREVKGSTLSLEFERNVRSHKGLTVYLEMDNIRKLAIGGSSDIMVEDRFDDMDALDLAIGGSGSIELKGKARRADISVAGSGDIRCSDLMAGEVKVSIAGSGDVYVGADNELEVSIAGSGDVRYKGTPRVKSSIAGSGNVQTM